MPSKFIHIANGKFSFFFMVEYMGFPGDSMVKTPPANAGDRKRIQSLDLAGRLGKEMATHSSIIAWEIPWTEEHGRLQSMSHKEIQLND